MPQRNILLIVSGGIAAYKSLDLIRNLRKQGDCVRVVLTAGGEKFVTPLSVSALSGTAAYTDMWSLKDETEMGHIRLTREADAIIVAPATANLIAKTACGIADDLASTLLLATRKDTPVLFAPAMNTAMWENPVTQENIEKLKARGIRMIGPETGDMACGESGPGRMSEPETLLKALNALLGSGPLRGLSAIVTSGPTFEPIDPVRFIGNRASGKQGHALAAALATQGAAVTLVTGPVSLPDPAGCATVHIETAAEMKNAVCAAMPCDIAVCAAAVADWRPEHSANQKIKKTEGEPPAPVTLTENPDILAEISRSKNRPKLVIGFSLETQDLVENANIKRRRKGCDWILANSVHANADTNDTPVFGADSNTVYLITETNQELWPEMSKTKIAEALVARMIKTLRPQADGA